MDAKNQILLIIEDDEILLRALYLMLQKNNYTIASAIDGDTGLKMAQRIKPNLIILDLLLPKMDGFAVLKYLKSDPATKEIPVIILSNLGADDDLEKAKNFTTVRDNFTKN